MRCWRFAAAFVFVGIIWRDVLRGRRLLAAALVFATAERMAPHSLRIQ